MVAAHEKATNRPVALKTGPPLPPFAVVPFAPTDIVWVTPGDPGSMTKLTAVELMEAGFDTETCTVVGEAISSAGIRTVNCVALRNVGVRLVAGVARLFGLVQTTFGPETK